MKILPAFLAALLGGAIVAAVLVATDVVGGETTTTVVEQAPIRGAAQQSQDTDGKGLTAREIYERVAPGVVFIRANVVQESQSPFDLFPQQQQGQSTGTGFFVDDDGHLLTNAHVVENASRVTVQVGEEDPVEAEIIGKDTSNDLALLKVNPRETKVTPLRLGNSDDVVVGDPTIAIGNPFGLDRTLTTGVVSALQREIQAPNGFTITEVIQTDAAVNPGNSGGPLLDAAGRVIGINSQIATGGGSGNVGIAFAVPINTAKEAIPQLKEDGEVNRAFLGITGRDIDDSLRDLNLPVDEGVLVQTVTPGGPAAEAGIQGGQTEVQVNGTPLQLGGTIITAIDGDEVEGMKDITRVVNSKKPGDKVQLEVRQADGKTETLEVTLGERPDQASTID